MMETLEIKNPPVLKGTREFSRGSTHFCSRTSLGVCTLESITATTDLARKWFSSLVCESRLQSRRDLPNTFRSITRLGQRQLYSVY